MVPGGWKPGGFPPGITLAAKLALIGAMSVRGADYLVGDSASTARRLSAVESAAPLWVWGTVLLAAGVIGFGSIIARIGPGVMGSHVAGWVIYWALGVGIISDTVQRTGVGWEVLIAPLVTLALGGVIVAAACRWSRWEYAELTTAGVAVTAALAVASIELDGLRNATILLAVGAVHALLALGTAAHLREAKIEREGVDLGKGAAV